MNLNFKQHKIVRLGSNEDDSNHSLKSILINCNEDEDDSNNSMKSIIITEWDLMPFFV